MTHLMTHLTGSAATVAHASARRRAPAARSGQRPLVFSGFVRAELV